MCPFTFEDERFTVSEEAAEQLGNIRLPDNRVLQVETWTRSLPPQPIIAGVATAEQIASRPIFDAVAV